MKQQSSTVYTRSSVRGKLKFVHVLDFLYKKDKHYYDPPNTIQQHGEKCWNKKNQSDKREREAISMAELLHTHHCCSLLWSLNELTFDETEKKNIRQDIFILLMTACMYLNPSNTTRSRPLHVTMSPTDPEPWACIFLSCCQQWTR